MFDCTIVSGSEAETLALAERIGTRLLGGEVIALVGELGSGKTAFTRGLARGLGIADPRLVSSPTYVLEQVYPARFSIHHYDAYRLASEAEFLALGFEEQCRGGNVLVVEWAEKVEGALPEAALRIELRAPDGLLRGTTREIRLRGVSSYWEPLLGPAVA